MYQSALLTALRKLKDEELLLKSSKGPTVAIIVDAFLGIMSAEEVEKFTEHSEANSVLLKSQQGWKSSKEGLSPVEAVFFNKRIVAILHT